MDVRREGARDIENISATTFAGRVVGDNITELMDVGLDRRFTAAGGTAPFS